MSPASDEDRRDGSEDQIVWLRHARVDLALHSLQRREGPGLLILHGLGQQAPSEPPEPLDAWPGSIHALDFTGHGRSGLSRGGGYTCEVLMADVDAALATLPPQTLYGQGLGAYVALLTAGARPSRVRGAILADGPGLAGGGARPVSPCVTYPHPNSAGPPDPFAMIELARDLRPRDYAAEYARQATEYSELDPALAICTAEEPEWIQAVGDMPGVEHLEARSAVSLYAELRKNEGEHSRSSQGTD